MKDLPYNIVSDYVSKSWLRNLLSFTCQSAIRVEDDIAKLKLLRVCDKFLMRRFIDAAYQGLYLQKLNLMRMYLHAISVADIATTDGKRIYLETWNLSGSNNLQEHLKWPRTEPLYPSSLTTLWQTALRDVFLQPYQLPIQQLLQFPLYMWYDKDIIDQWKAFFDDTTGQLYVKENNQWRTYIFHGRERLICFYPGWEVNKFLLPIASQAASVYPQEDVGLGPGFSGEYTTTFFHTPFPIYPSSYYPATDYAVTDILTIFLHTSVGTRLLLNDYNLPCYHCHAIAESIRNGTCTAVCDGSFNQNQAEDYAGTTAFTVCATQADTNPLTGKNWTTG